MSRRRSRRGRPPALPERRRGAKAQTGRQSVPLAGNLRRDDVRSAASWVVEHTLESHAPATRYLDSALARCDVRDHALLRELALGTLRWLRRIDHVIHRASDRPMQRIDLALRAPLRVAVYQLLWLDRVPSHAVVHEAVEQVRHRARRNAGAIGFANAVLRRIARSPQRDAWPVTHDDPVVRLAIEHSHPDLLVRRWWDRLGADETRRLLIANNRPKPMHLLAFRDRGGRERLAERLIDRDIEVEPSMIAPLGLIVRGGHPLADPAFDDGAFYVQDEGSQAAALLPPPRPGERILDAAAAPGGKSFAMLAHTPDARIVAADVGIGRLATLWRNGQRLRRRLTTLAADGLRPPFRAAFDRVVVDLPCTGTGTLRKHPELKWRISTDEIQRLGAQARTLLGGLAPAVAPGGLLIAITCSLEPEENEDAVDALRADHPRWLPVDLAAAGLPHPLGQWITGPGRWQLPTADDHDGFTVHVLRRAR
ncbi:MAG: transcription antitermination factor NusB [Acidobacteriota bacterium]